MAVLELAHCSGLTFIISFGRRSLPTSLAAPSSFFWEPSRKRLWLYSLRGSSDRWAEGASACILPVAPFTPVSHLHISFLSRLSACGFLGPAGILECRTGPGAGSGAVCAARAFQPRDGLPLIDRDLSTLIFQPSLQQKHCTVQTQLCKKKTYFIHTGGFFSSFFTHYTLSYTHVHLKPFQCYNSKEDFDL